MAKKLKVAEIHTSDRQAFRRCRRKWNWTSGLRMNLQPIVPAEALWMGSGFHYAMEDFHGYNRYGDPEIAFLAYLMAFRRTPKLALPDTWEDVVKLTRAMLQYYKKWIKYFDPLETYWVDGKPQVEVDFKIELPEAVQEMGRRAGYDKVVYAGHFDRVVIDEWDRLWVMDYKTAKMIKVDHFEGDSQVSAYSWAAHQLYQKTVGGAIWQQHFKGPERPPLELANGNLSCNKQQKVTHLTYRQALIEKYGSVGKAPAANVDFLGHLGEIQDDHGDRMIHRAFIDRNATFLKNQAEQITQESLDMLNPDTPLYPNQQFTCSWDCPFNVACVSMDDGSDWEHEIKSNTQSRSAPQEMRWRNQLPEKAEVCEFYGIEEHGN